MQVKISKTFEVKQPVAQVWEFLSDPRKVATCIPGAQITEAQSWSCADGLQRRTDRRTFGCAEL
ncbi:MAG: hypothetical protein DMG19_03140 [Acidobacteria bacterium]|nr:MAG: hypothetical protein DMG19_03140 [Acidobacteriota bacterium]